jgi:hypothetical protein
MTGARVLDHGDAVGFERPETAQNRVIKLGRAG